jgi:lipopolysaccharide export system protein LptA
MSKRFLFGALVILCTSALTAVGQSREPSPSPAADKASKGDPILGFSQKDRPKNAKTEITCKDEATFDNTAGVAVFITGVFVKDPQFNLYCDKLTVYMNKERKGIDHAEAEGHVVIVQDNVNEKGESQKSIGRSGRAVFRPDTGEATLTIWPQLQQGVNNHISTDEKTIMTLYRNGRLKTEGPNRTAIVSESTEPAR